MDLLRINNTFIWFTGTVVSVDDPLKIGRVKVRALPFYKEAQDDDLPWAQCLQPIQSAAHHEIGISPTGITVGSAVVGFFADASLAQQPIIMGTYAGTNDVTPFATDSAVELAAIGPNPPSDANPLYPNNKVITTAAGHVIELDDTPGAERILLKHATGTSVEINSDGRRVTRVVDDDFELIAKDKKFYVAGDVTMAVVGNIKLQSNGECEISSTTQINLASPLITINDPPAEPVKVPTEFTHRLTRKQEKTLATNTRQAEKYRTPANQAMGIDSGAEVGPGPTDSAPVANCSAGVPETATAHPDIVQYLNARLAEGTAWHETGHNDKIIQLYHDVGFQSVTSDQVAWCAAFVGSVLKNTCHAYLPSLLAAAYDSYGSRVTTRDHAATKEAIVGGHAKLGDILVFDRDEGSGHVAFFMGYSDGQLTYVGGNQSNTVCARSLPIDNTRVRSLRRPYRTAAS